MQRREVWTKGLPLLSSRPPPLPSSSSPRLIIHSRHGEPRESRSLPFSSFFFSTGWRAAKNSLVAATSEGGIDSFRRPASSPPLPQYFHLLLPPPPSFLRQIASFRLTSFRGTRIASTSSSHDDCLPRYLFLSLFPDS